MLVYHAAAVAAIRVAGKKNKKKKGLDSLEGMGVGGTTKNLVGLSGTYGPPPSID